MLTTVVALFDFCAVATLTFGLFIRSNAAALQKEINIDS
jgi:hypothetical protein